MREGGVPGSSERGRACTTMLGIKQKLCWRVVFESSTGIARRPITSGSSKGC